MPCDNGGGGDDDDDDEHNYNDANNNDIHYLQKISDGFNFVQKRVQK